MMRTKIRKRIALTLAGLAFALAVLFGSGGQAASSQAGMTGSDQVQQVVADGGGNNLPGGGG